MVDSVKRSGVGRLAAAGVFAMLLFACALPQVASATSVWKTGGEEVGVSLGLKSSGTLTFKDKKGNVFGEELSVTCAVSGEVVARASGGGEVAKWSTSSCKATVGSICPEPKISVLHLPWSTELTEGAGGVREVVTNSGEGSPEYEFICNGSNEDNCSGTTSAHASNVSNGVDLTFESSSASLTCARGGAGAGRLEGTVLLESPSSGTLTVAAASGPEGWAISRTVLTKKETAAVKSSGTLKFITTTGPWIECKIESEGHVGSLLEGEITKLTAKSCSTKGGTCPVPSIVALNLPWHTGLEAGSVADSSFVESIEGTEGGPRYEIVCNGTWEASCPWAHSVGINNGSPMGSYVEEQYRTGSEAGICSPWDGFSHIEGYEKITDNEEHELTVK